MSCEHTASAISKIGLLVQLLALFWGSEIQGASKVKIDAEIERSISANIAWMFKWRLGERAPTTTGCTVSDQSKHLIVACPEVKIALVLLRDQQGHCFVDSFYPIPLGIDYLRIRPQGSPCFSKEDLIQQSFSFDVRIQATSSIDVVATKSAFRVVSTDLKQFLRPGCKIQMPWLKERECVFLSFISCNGTIRSIHSYSRRPNGSIEYLLSSEKLNDNEGFWVRLLADKSHWY